TQINLNQNESQFKSKNITSDQSVENNEGKPESTFIDEVTILPSTFPRFENDKGLYENCSKLNEDKIRALLLAGPCQPKECDLLGKEYKLSNDKSHFRSSWYYINKKKSFVGDNNSPWLSYSPSKHYAYCHYCWLFGDEATKRSAWYTGFTTWKHFYQSSMRHGLSKVHLNNGIAAATFLQKSDIHHKLNKQISEEAKKWKTILNILFDTVKTLSGLGVAFRGHRANLQNDEYPGIYLTVIKLISRHNPILFTHIESPNKIKYSSKTIIYELLSTFADKTRKIIVDECKDAKLFTLLADSTTDVAHLDQMDILLRYVLIQNEDKDPPKVYIKESFLCFTQLKKGDAAYICSEIVNLLFEKYGLEKKHLCGQGYDGAAVKAGKQGGLQAKIKEFVGNETFVPYIHCAAHQLNLVLVHTAEENTSPSIKVYFTIIQTVFNYFAHSHRRWEALLDVSNRSSSNPNSFGIQLLKELKKEMFNKQIENDALDAKNDKPRELHIKSLSNTRWAARLKAVEALIQNFEFIVNCLENEISRVAASGDGIMATNTLLFSVNWLFFLNLLSLVFQAKLKNLRNEESYNNFMTKAKTNWEKMGWDHADFPKVRNRRIKKMAGEKAADSSLETSDKHRINYYEVLDTMCSELHERATGFKEINNVFGFLMPENLQKLKEDDL
ncbi:zinc finger MYM-type protein 6-like, partial [Aphis craccivora]